MAHGHLLHRQDLVVELDYGQFYLHTADNDPGLAETALGDALDGEGIAQQGGVLVVTSPHQNNFAVPLAVETWDGEPPDDLPEWQEAFEAHLEVTEAGLAYESPTMDFVEIDVPAGSYYALITGRGFIAHGWPGSTEPGDAWRIRLWPSTGPTGPRRLRAFSVDDLAHVETPRPVHPTTDDDGSAAWEFSEDGDEQRKEVATQAALRIAADLDRSPGSRRLSGATGQARLDVVLPRDIRAVWPLFADLDVTGISAPNERSIGNEFAMQKSYRDADSFAGNSGGIVCRWTELSPPHRVAMTWRWVQGAIPGTPRLPHDALLAMTLTDVTAEENSPRTRVVLTHSDIPAEWVEDMTTIWNSKFDQWAYQSRPKKRRR